MRRLVACALVLAACGGTKPPEKPRLHVDAAYSVERAFALYARAFKTSPVALETAGSTQMPALVRGPHPPDVVTAAGTRILERLYAEGLVEKPRVFAETELVLAIPNDKNTVTGFGDLAKPGIRISTQSRGTPAGTLTRLVIGRLPFSGVERRAVAANLRDSKHNVDDVRRHVADAAFVYAPEVRGVRKLNFGNPARPGIALEIAVVKGTPRLQAARAFVAGLHTRAGRAILRRGLLKPR